MHRTGQRNCLQIRYYKGHCQQANILMMLSSFFTGVLTKTCKASNLCCFSVNVFSCSFILFFSLLNRKQRRNWEYIIFIDTVLKLIVATWQNSTVDMTFYCSTSSVHCTFVPKGIISQYDIQWPSSVSAVYILSYHACMFVTLKRLMFMKIISC